MMKMRVVGAFLLLVILIGSLMVGYKTFGLVMLLCSLFGYLELINVKYDNKRVYLY